MATKHQVLGARGEALVAKRCRCPQCKKFGTLKRLPVNFKCADVVCDFCGFLAQVKTTNVSDLNRLPTRLLGAAWNVQKDRMDAGIYFPIFLILMAGRKTATYYISADMQIPEMFVARNPLSKEARRAGWRGFMYNLSTLPDGAIVRLTYADTPSHTG